jgi:hypothetical protein
MYHAIYATRDTTLYEKNPRRNAGIDQVLELLKYVESVPDENGFYYDGTYNSRILIKFDIDHLKNLIASNTVSRTSKYYLSLKATDASELPIDYNIDVFAVSQSWDNGVGHYNDYPEITTGASWTYRNGYYDGNGLTWINNSFSTATTGSFSTNSGGGTWYTGSQYYATQNFNYVKNPDIRINVSNIVKKWLSGSIPNNGFIVKRTSADEFSTDFKGTIRFFSTDTHTIYIPKLEMVWDDSNISMSGSLPEVSDDFQLFVSNINKNYKTNSKYKFRIKSRDKYPTLDYTTTNNYLNFKRLPTSSYYAIQDSVTEDYIIPFDTGSTRLSIDSEGNYFNINMNSFLPERFYKIVFRVLKDGGFTEHIIDEGFYFKVIR